MRVDAAELDRGFRSGVEWFSIYSRDRKVGFIRNRRLRRDGELVIETQTRFVSAGRNTQLELEVRFDPRFELRRFDAELQSDELELHARGERRDATLHLEVTGLPTPLEADLPADAAPRINQSLRPLLMREDLEPGRRFRYELFDPMTMQTRSAQIEYLGREEIVIMGETQSAHHLRQVIAGEPLESWLNDLGEVLREELPGGLEARRESEAEAIWGLPDGPSASLPAPKDAAVEREEAR